MKIIIAAGGTGGHLVPALRAAEELRIRGHKVYFVGSFRMGTAMIERGGFEWKDIGSCGLRSYSPVDMFKFMAGAVKGVNGSLVFLRSWRPDKVVGFGGYPAFPVVLSAALQGIPVLIHEQNVVPGKANRVMACFARRIAVSFPGTRSFRNCKTVFTGCPTNIPATLPDRGAVLAEWQLSPARKTVLIFGGSQGSGKLNDTAVKALAVIKNKIDLQVIHITGRSDPEAVKRSYEAEGVPSVVMAFCHEMPKVYVCADIVIGRAGALTVTELGILGKRAILVPYPHAGGHQKFNAMVLQEAGLAEVIDDDDLTSESLAKAAITLLGREILIDQKITAERFPRDAAIWLADEIEKI